MTESLINLPTTVMKRCIQYFSMLPIGSRGIDDMVILRRGNYSDTRCGLDCRHTESCTDFTPAKVLLCKVFPWLLWSTVVDKAKVKSAKLANATWKAESHGQGCCMMLHAYRSGAAIDRSQYSIGAAFSWKGTLACEFPCNTLATRYYFDAR
jgi:hypothetical protein